MAFSTLTSRAWKNWLTRVVRHPSQYRLPEPYSVVRPLGRGGEGEAWLATDTLLGRQVVVKRLVAESLDARDRLLSRLETLATGALPTVPIIYAVTAERIVLRSVLSSVPLRAPWSVLWLVTEYIPGCVLSSLNARSGRSKLALPHVLSITIDLVAGLDALASAGFVHGDVSPANVVIDERGRARLIDFGQAGRIGGPPSGHGVPGFALRHDCPLESSPDDDRYALGALLFWLLSGEVPTQLNDPAGNRVFVPPNNVNKAPGFLDEMLWAVATSLINPNPERRPTLSHLLVSLRRDQDRLPLGARDNLARFVASTMPQSLADSSESDPGSGLQSSAFNNSAFNSSGLNSPAFNSSGLTQAVRERNIRRGPRAWVMTSIVAVALGLSGLMMSLQNTSSALAVTLNDVSLTPKTDLGSTLSLAWLHKAVRQGLPGEWQLVQAAEHTMGISIDCDDRLCQIVAAHVDSQPDSDPNPNPDSVSGPEVRSMNEHVHQDLLRASAGSTIWSGAIEALSREFVHCLTTRAR